MRNKGREVLINEECWLFLFTYCMKNWGDWKKILLITQKQGNGGLFSEINKQEGLLIYYAPKSRERI